MTDLTSYVERNIKIGNSLAQGLDIIAIEEPWEILSKNDKICEQQVQEAIEKYFSLTKQTYGPQNVPFNSVDGYVRDIAPKASLRECLFYTMRNCEIPRTDNAFAETILRIVKMHKLWGQNYKNN